MKKIPDEIIRKAMDSIDDAEYIDLLKSIIAKQKKQSKQKTSMTLRASFCVTALPKDLRAICFTTC